jgi:DNA-binding CsgD family transcriptional regulator
MRDSDAEEALINDIYEAAAVPELWPATLERLSAIPEGVGGVLFATDLRPGAVDPRDTRWVASPVIQPLFEEFVRSGWAARNTRPQRLAALKYAGFITDHDAYTPEELEREPVYVEVFRKVGLGWATGTMFAMPSGDLVVFSFERAYERGPVERAAVAAMDRLRPHLGRAGLLAWRLGLQRAQAMTAALETVGLPAAVLRASGQLLSASQSFDALIPTVAQDRIERLVLSDAAADALLADALGSLARPGSAPSVQSIPIAANEKHPAMIVHLLPVRRAAHDIFLQGATIVIITPVDRASVPTAEVLEGLFDLSPAEARVARGIGTAQTVEELAAQLGVSRETVRAQLRAVFAKTGLNRQAELANLLSGLKLPR